MMREPVRRKPLLELRALSVGALSKPNPQRQMIATFFRFLAQVGTALTPAACASFLPPLCLAGEHPGRAQRGRPSLVAFRFCRFGFALALPGGPGRGRRVRVPGVPKCQVFVCFLRRVCKLCLPGEPKRAQRGQPGQLSNFDLRSQFCLAGGMVWDSLGPSFSLYTLAGTRSFFAHLSGRAGRGLRVAQRPGEPARTPANLPLVAAAGWLGTWLD